MSHVERAVAEIRKSEAFAGLNDDEPVTLQALERDLAATAAEAHAVKADLDRARLYDDGFADLYAVELANLHSLYSEIAAQLVLLEAATAADARVLH